MRSSRQQLTGFDEQLLQQRAALSFRSVKAPGAVRIRLDAKQESVVRSAWATLCGIVTTQPDADLPIDTLRALLDRVAAEIHTATGDIAYTMNQFVICVGTYVAPLAESAIDAARRIGRVKIDMGETACKVPEAEPYILKCRSGHPVAPKRKTIRC